MKTYTVKIKHISTGVVYSVPVLAASTSTHRISNQPTERNQMKTIDELEIAAYISGDTDRAGLLARIAELQKALGQAVAALDDIPSETERNRDAHDLENLKEFFYDCFRHLAGDYPCPSWSSDYDKNVIFETLDRGAE